MQQKTFLPPKKENERPCLMCGAHTKILETEKSTHDTYNEGIGDKDLVQCLNRGKAILGSQGEIIGREPKEGACAYAIDWESYRFEARKQGYFT